MSLKLVPNPANVLQFPPGRMKQPTVEMVQQAAPGRALVASILEERGLPATDLQQGFVRDTARQLALLEPMLGRDGAIMQLRAVLNAHLKQAGQACSDYREAADQMIALEVRAEALHRQKPWLRGTLAGEVYRARAEFRNRALAARAAADAALGVAEGLACYIRSAPGMPAESWQLTLPLAIPVTHGG